MHIAINAQLMSSASGYRDAGVSNYCRQLLIALGELGISGATYHQFSAFIHTPDVVIPGIDLHYSSPALEQPLRRIVWEQTALPWRLARAKRRVDLVHGLVNVLPLSTGYPGVVTVHDLSFLRYPQLFPQLKRLYLTALCRLSVARAAQVIAVSRQTADDVARFLHADPARVHVIHHGVDAKFSPGSPAGVEKFRLAHNLPKRFWLYLGTLEPRKNLPLLLDAFARYRQAAAQTQRNENDVTLVLAGGKGWQFDAIFERVQALGLHDAVQFPGFIPAADLPNWYRAAELFLYPSRFEGFGLPVLEAMACGTPVLCSDAPGVREVAGDAAWRLPPDDAAAWQGAMTELAAHPRRRERMAAAGLARAAAFTWRRAAEATIGVYERAAPSFRRP